MSQGLELILLFTQAVFPSYRRVAIDFSGYSYSRNFPAFHRAFPGLTTLVLHFNNVVVDIGAFLDATHFPALRELSLLLSFPMLYDSPCAYVHFLKRHATTLNVLHILEPLMLNLGDPKVVANTVNLRFKCLTTLHMHPALFWILTPSVRARATVTTLRVTGRSSDMDDASFTAPWPSVHRLAMSLCLSSAWALPAGSDMYLDFQFSLRRLSALFPNIETLRLDTENQVSAGG